MPTDILKTTSDIETGKRQRQSELVVNLGLSCNSLLAVVKLLAGIVGHSQALLADGINSVSDVIYFIVVKVFVRLSGTPADQEHPYGHHQFESIAALVVGAFVITTGAAIFWDSVNTAFDLLVGKTQVLPVRTFALAAALATVVIKVLLMLHAKGIGRRTGNLAVVALARDHRNDIFASLGATAGILLSLLGLRWFDPVAGAVVAAVVAKTGFDILREASSSLMDDVPGEELRSQIKAILAGMEAVKSIEEIHAHRFGPYFVVNVTVGIDGSLSVSQGDGISDEIERKLVEGIEMLRKVYVHYHPTAPATANV